MRLSCGALKKDSFLYELVGEVLERLDEVGCIRRLTCGEERSSAPISPVNEQ